MVLLLLSLSLLFLLLLLLLESLPCMLFFFSFSSFLLSFNTSTVLVLRLREGPLGIWWKGGARAITKKISSKDLTSGKKFVQGQSAKNIFVQMRKKLVHNYGRDEKNSCKGRIDQPKYLLFHPLFRSFLYVRYVFICLFNCRRCSFCDFIGLLC